MQDRTTIEEREVEQRAHWIAWRYGLDKESILEALKRANVKVTYTVIGDFFRYLDFSPSLDHALVLTMPKTIVQMYLTADLEDLRRWEELTSRLVGKNADDDLDAEGLCRWEAEQYLLPD